ncbi:MAG TPA: penicillin-binding protein 2 [Acidimicrobiales bacterium]|nr:penicillin-binding protein 2 [Acidimicrobiales bacterium]
MPLESPRLRLGIVAIVVVSLFAALLARLWYLQVLAAPQYRTQANVNRVRTIYTEAPRGRILDRQGRVLVDNRVSDAVVVSREELGSRRAEVVPRLAEVLKMQASDVQKRLDDKRYSPFKPIPVATDVPKETIIYLREHQSDYPGVGGVQLTERYYPYGSLGAHLLGWVGEINGGELATFKKKGYKEGDSIGKSGIEKVYEDDLRGKPQIERLEVDSKGRVLGSLGTTPAVQGHDVQLTLDLDVQKLAEDSLQQGLAAARGSYDKQQAKHFIAPAGSVVVQDPRDGSILALASNPTYDPSVFVNGIKPELFAQLNDPASGYPLNDRAIQGQYAPGSTFKLITSLAALGHGMIDTKYTVDDGGKIKIGNRIFKNAGGEANGRVNITRALTVSSDVFFYTLGNQFWLQRSQFGDAMQDEARQLGMGKKTGIALPFEAAGRIPDPDTRKKLHDQNPKAFPNGQWFAGDNVNLAIGQGEMVVTPLQLVNAYATFANGGTVWVPRVGAAVQDQVGTKLRDIPPQAVRKLVLPPEVRDPIMQGLQGVATDPRGTAVGAFAGFPFQTFPIAGKTGTAQAGNKQDTSLFVAFGPTTDPQYTVGVVMEEAGFGASAAAPVARRILESLAGKPTHPVNYAGGGPD